jgi:hypothetical protein
MTRLRGLARHPVRHVERRVATRYLKALRARRVAACNAAGHPGATWFKESDTGEPLTTALCVWCGPVDVKTVRLQALSLDP